MGIVFILCAALFTSISNLCLRKSIDAGGSSKAYLFVQLAISFFVMILLNPIRTGNYAWDNEVVSLGLLGGVLLGTLMWGIGKTLEKGPPGLSFAVLNSSTVIPAIFLALIFGPSFGHTYTFSNAVGSALVILGLFWAGWTSEKNPQKGVWACFAAFIFLLHILFLVYLQWWALLLKTETLSSLLPLNLDASKVEWFMPAVLFIAMAFQAFIYFFTERRQPTKMELIYGLMGGVTNGICTFLLILAPQKASSWENAMIFPIFSVAIILICNSWAQLLYKEKVNWKASGLCVMGILVGTVAWKSALSSLI